MLLLIAAHTVSLTLSPVAVVNQPCDAVLVQLPSELLGRNDPAHCELTPSLPHPRALVLVSHLTRISTRLTSP